MADFATVLNLDPEVGSFTEDVVYVSKWAQRWLKHAYQLVTVGGPAEHFAKGIVKEVDASFEDPEDYLDKHVYEDTHTITSNVAEPEVEIRTKTKSVVRKGCRTKFAASVSKLAYNKFGERKMTEANVLVTRKWIQKLLDEPKYKDMRTADKNLAIDRALFMSFVPTKYFQQMRVAVTTKQWEQRMDAGRVFGGFWGKVFGVGKLQEAELLESY